MVITRCDSLIAACCQIPHAFQIHILCMLFHWVDLNIQSLIFMIEPFFNTSACMSEIYVYTSLWKLIVWLFVIYLRYCDFTQETECCTSLLLTAVRPIIRQQHIAIELLCCVSFCWYALLCVINFNLPYLCGSRDIDNFSSNILFALHKLFFNTLWKNVKIISYIIIINEMRLFVDHR